MLSPDNNVQDPANGQNYNRYAYVLNNPLKYTDPTGEKFTFADAVAAVSIVTGFIIIATGNPVGWYLVGAGLIHFGIALEFNKETKDWDQASNQAGFTIGYTFDAPWGGQQQPDFSNTIEFTPVTEEDPFDGAIASNDPNFIGPMQSGGVWYGNFTGPGPDEDPYFLRDPNNPTKILQPIDVLDYNARIHDYYYYIEGASGVSGALFNTGVTYADVWLRDAAASIIRGYHANEIDFVTNQPISYKTYLAAKTTYFFFDNIIDINKTPRPSLNDYLQQHYDRKY